MCACSFALVISDSLWPCGLWPSRLLCPWDSPGKNTRVGYHALLQGIIPIQGLNPCLLNLLHWQVGSLPLALPGPPKILSYLFKIKWSRMLVNVYVSRVYVKWHTFLGPIVLTSAVVNVIWPWPFKEYHFYVLYSCEIIWGKWESLG